MKGKLRVWLISLMTIRPLMSWRTQIELILNNNKSTLFFWHFGTTLFLWKLQCVFTGLPSTRFSGHLCDAIYPPLIWTFLVGKKPPQKRGCEILALFYFYLHWNEGIISIPNAELVEMILAAGGKTKDSVKPACIKQKSAHTNPHLHVQNELVLAQVRFCQCEHAGTLGQLLKCCTRRTHKFYLICFVSLDTQQQTLKSWHGVRKKTARIKYLLFHHC